MGLGGLNFRVRDGNGWDPSGMATGNSSGAQREFEIRISKFEIAVRLRGPPDHVYQEQRMLNRTTD